MASTPASWSPRRCLVCSLLDLRERIFKQGACCSMGLVVSMFFPSFIVSFSYSEWINRVFIWNHLWVVSVFAVDFPSDAIENYRVYISKIEYLYHASRNAVHPESKPDFFWCKETKWHIFFIKRIECNIGRSTLNTSGATLEYTTYVYYSTLESKSISTSFQCFSKSLLERKIRKGWYPKTILFSRTFQSSSSLVAW